MYECVPISGLLIVFMGFGCVALIWTGMALHSAVMKRQLEDTGGFKLGGVRFMATKQLRRKGDLGVRISDAWSYAKWAALALIIVLIVWGAS